MSSKLVLIPNMTELQQMDKSATVYINKNNRKNMDTIYLIVLTSIWNFSSFQLSLVSYLEKGLEHTGHSINMCLIITLVKKLYPGLPWWRSGWESACQCRGRGFEPWSGKIPHAAGQLRPWATATEPARLEPVLRNKRGRDSERPAHRDEEWPPLAATRESPRT